MSYSVRLIPTAEDTYDSLTEQLRSRWGNVYVAKLENKLVKCIEIISKDPYIYPIHDEVTGTRKCVLHKNCSMFYTVGEREVIITWFLDNRQDPLFDL